jgi:Flp pilus assembly protein TadG
MLSEKIKKLTSDNRGNALVEFAVLLPLLLLLVLVITDLCLLLDHQMRLIHLSREAASVLSRGASFDETFVAITAADGPLGLDGARGRIILTRVTLDENGNPIVGEQRSIGRLSRASTVGNSPGGPATIPNGRSLPGKMSVVVVELFSQQRHFMGRTAIAPGQGPIVLSSLAAY